VISKDEVLDYIESTSPKKIKQLAMTVTAMLNSQQLEVLNRRFRKKIDFSPNIPEKPEPEPEPVKKERVPTPSETMPKEIKQRPQPQPEPTQDDLDFDFDMNEDD
jgi:outer membrane biosynthesis protein TonB